MTPPNYKGKARQIRNPREGSASAPLAENLSPDEGQKVKTQ